MEKLILASQIFANILMCNTLLNSIVNIIKIKSNTKEMVDKNLLIKIINFEKDVFLLKFILILITVYLSRNINLAIWFIMFTATVILSITFSIEHKKIERKFRIEQHKEMRDKIFNDDYYKKFYEDFYKGSKGTLE